MTLRDIDNALPPVIRFVNDSEDKAGVLVHNTYMGMIYNTDEGLFYNSQNYRDCSDDCIRKILSYLISTMNYYLVYGIQRLISMNYTN